MPLWCVQRVLYMVWAVSGAPASLAVLGGCPWVGTTIDDAMGVLACTIQASYLGLVSCLTAIFLRLHECARGGRVGGPLGTGLGS